MELDRIDRRILDIVQGNNLTPHREIADKIGLSAPAVTRRLKRLRGNGVIRGDVSLVDDHALGRPLTLIVEVVANSEQAAELDGMRRSFQECEQVQQCYYVTGEPDFVLIFNVSDMGEYELLTRSLFLDCDNVKRFTTLVSMETVKASQRVITSSTIP